MKNLVRTTCFGSALLFALASPPSEAESIGSPLELLRIQSQSPESVLQLTPTGATITTAAGLTSGGGIATGSSLRLTASFGESFAGSAYYPNAGDSLRAEADRAFATGAAFWLDREGGALSPFEQIIRRGVISDGGTDGNEDLLASNYSAVELADARKRLLAALWTNPYDEEAIASILRTIQAQVHYHHVRSDAFKRRWLRSRLNADLSASNVFDKEKAQLDRIVEEQENSLRATFDTILLALQVPPLDALLLGLSGAETKAAFSENVSKEAREIIRLAISGLHRYGEAKFELSKLKLMRDFQSENGRRAMLDEMAQTKDYITEGLRLLSPFLSREDIEGSSTEIIRLSSLQSQIDALRSDTEQGYNPFGFLPDFVPFTAGTAMDSTYLAMKGTGQQYINLAKQREAEAEAFFSGQQTTEASFATAMNDVEARYAQRLQSLMGTVKIGGAVQPDYLTFLAPDVDTDGDGISERDALRTQVQADADGVTYDESSGKGEIYQQYLAIAQADAAIDAAENDLQNLYTEIELREETAQAVLALNEEVATIILQSGTQVGALIRQRAAIQRAAESKARKKGRFGAIVNTLAAAGTALVKEGTKGPALAAITLVNGGTQIWTQAQIGSIMGNALNDVAEVDVAIEQLRAATNAKVQILQGQQNLLQAQTEIKVLVLREANFQLALFSAMRNQTAQVARLTNLISEAIAISAEYARTARLTEEQGNTTFGWLDDDVRLVAGQQQVLADKAFEAAKGWTFITLRALDYYATLPPNATNLSSLYSELYAARNSAQLEALLVRMDGARTSSDLVWDADRLSCVNTARLSLKYHIATASDVNTFGNTDGEGVPSITSNLYTMVDQLDGKKHSGPAAFQAAFKNLLRRSVSTTAEGSSLRVVFATDLVNYADANGASQFRAQNPFAQIDVQNARITGDTARNCPAGQFGISVNLTGTLNPSGSLPVVLSQAGDSYLKHSKFDEVAEPWEAYSIHRAFTQRAPYWLAGDLGGSGPVLIGSAIESQFAATIRNVTTSGLAQVTQRFANRAVANSSWELEIDDAGFMQELLAWLQEPISNNPGNEFLSDIQLVITWNHRDR